MFHKLFIVINGSSICWITLQILKWAFFLESFFCEFHLQKLTWINPCQQWIQINEANGTEKTYDLRVIETVERKGFFEFIWGIDTLKNMVDKFK